MQIAAPDIADCAPCCFMVGQDVCILLLESTFAPAGRFVAAHFDATKCFFGNMVMEAIEPRLTCTFRHGRRCAYYKLARIVPRAPPTQSCLHCFRLQPSLLIRPSPQLKACFKPAGIIRSCPTCVTLHEGRYCCMHTTRCLLFAQTWLCWWHLPKH